MYVLLGFGLAVILALDIMAIRSARKPKKEWRKP